MSTIKPIMVLLAIGVLAPLRASATDYLFTGQGGDQSWHNAANWDPAEVPDQDDQATIPGDKRCDIYEADASINKVIVQSPNGLLKLIGRTLDFPLPAARITLDPNAQIWAEQVSRLRTAGDLEIHGSGLIRTNGPGNASLAIERYSGGIPPCLRIGMQGQPPRPTIKGNVRFLVSIDNHGRLLVDAPGEQMEFGEPAPSALWIEIAGSAQGAFEVSNGTMKFYQTRPYAFRCPWVVQGGTLHLTQHAAHSHWLHCKHLVSVGAGTLQFDWHFVSDGGLTFTGGKIKTAPGMSVRFPSS